MYGFIAISFTCIAYLFSEVYGMLLIYVVTCISGAFFFFLHVNRSWLGRVSVHKCMPTVK